jgi:transcription factor-like protein
MTFMVRMSHLSAESMKEDADQSEIRAIAIKIHADLQHWWQSCIPEVRNQSNNWRGQTRSRELTVAEALQEEGVSSTRSCVFACIIYVNHILNPVNREPRSPEVTEAIAEIVEIAKETPEGYGLEMGIYFGLFMAGIAVFNEPEIEDVLRKKLKADTRVSIYVSIPHALRETPGS